MLLMMVVVSALMGGSGAGPMGMMGHENQVKNSSSSPLEKAAGRLGTSIQLRKLSDAERENAFFTLVGAVINLPSHASPQAVAIHDGEPKA